MLDGNSVRGRGGSEGHVPPSKNCRTVLAKKTVLRGCQNVPSNDKHRKKSNVFYRYMCSLWVRTAAIFSSISCSHYDFLHKPNKNNLCSALIRPTLHRFRTVYFSSTLKHVSSFFLSISESMLKALRICQSSGSQTFLKSYLRLRV